MGTFKPPLTLSQVYPVGSVYMSTSATNPATTFGFGTWAAFAAGRTIIGVGTSDQAFAAAATGGESNHTLTGAESGVPAHTHPSVVFSGSSTVGLNAGAATAVALSYSGTGNLPLTVTANTAANAASAHNTLPPYIVTYIWQRTA